MRDTASDYADLTQMAPLETPVLGLLPAEIDVIRDLIASRKYNLVARAAYRYERKQYESFNSLGTSRINTSYGDTDNDDIVVQATFVINGGWRSTKDDAEPRAALKKMSERLIEAEREEALITQQAKVAAAEEALAQARAALDALKD